jgi:dinuclear metal center YbgI/SA1388 family protein
MGKHTPRIHDLIGLLNGLYPPGLAEDWDNVGLQVGDPAKALTRGMVALDPGLDAVCAARAVGAQVLVTHHPLIFRGLKQLTPEDEVGRVVWRAVQDDVAVISVHTNLDSARGGLNVWLAERLGILDPEPLRQADGSFLKLVVFVPSGHEAELADALFAAGAGGVGRYDQCSFRVPGTGTFRPGEGADPFIGRPGHREEVEELRLEVLVPRNRLSRVLDRMFKTHPYEEVAYDLVPLDNRLPGAGLGRIGRLAQALPLEGFADCVKKALGCATVRVVGADDVAVSKVAVCGGSGADLVRTAHRQGADVIVTGDVKYHEARSAEALGIAVVDAGHFATEHLMVDALTQVLNQSAEARGWDLFFAAFAQETDPFRVC